MNRPERKSKNLEAKIAAKASRSPKRAGAKLRRWKRTLAATQPVSEG